MEDKGSFANGAISKGDWILVKYATKKLLKHYVGQVEKFGSDNTTVNFPRLNRKNKNPKTTIFNIPEQTDLDDIENENIIRRLPEPSTGRRGEKIFSVSFSQYKLE